MRIPILFHSTSMHPPAARKGWLDPWYEWLIWMTETKAIDKTSSPNLYSTFLQFFSNTPVQTLFSHTFQHNCKGLCMKGQRFGICIFWNWEVLTCNHISIAHDMPLWPLANQSNRVTIHFHFFSIQSLQVSAKVLLIRDSMPIRWFGMLLFWHVAKVQPEMKEIYM